MSPADLISQAAQAIQEARTQGADELRALFNFEQDTRRLTPDERRRVWQRVTSQKPQLADLYRS